VVKLFEMKKVSKHVRHGPTISDANKFEADDLEDLEAVEYRSYVRHNAYSTWKRGDRRRS